MIATSLGYHRGVAGHGGRDGWTLLTSHGHVLVEIARDPQARIRDLAAAAGITERATTAIIADLEAAGYVTRTRVGRRNRYTVHLDVGFRHMAQDDLQIGPFLALLAESVGEPGLGDSETAANIEGTAAVHAAEAAAVAPTTGAADR